MKRLKKYYIIVTILFCLIFLGILVSQIYGYFQISNNKSSVSETEYRIGKIDEANQNLAALEKRYAEIKEDITKINIALPDAKDTSILISDLDSLAVASGLKFTTIQTNTSGKKSSGGGDLSLLQTIKGKYSYELPLEIKIEGSFAAFADFIGKLENYQRLVNISSIEISKVSTTGVVSDTIEAKIKLTAYLKK